MTNRFLAIALALASLVGVQQVVAKSSNKTKKGTATSSAKKHHKHMKKHAA